MNEIQFEGLITGINMKENTISIKTTQQYKFNANNVEISKNITHINDKIYFLPEQMKISNIQNLIGLANLFNKKLYFVADIQINNNGIVDSITINEIKICQD